MKVLFVWFNFDSPVGFSHGLAVLSRDLKEAGHSVEVLHVNERMGTPYDRAMLAAEFARRAPDVVGFSFGTNHAWAAREMALVARRECPGSFIVCGGIHTTINPDEVIAWPGVDALVVGEADDGRLSAVLAGLQNGKPAHDAAGFWFNSGGAVIRNRMAPPVDLESAPRRADLGLFDYRRIFTEMRGYAEVTSGRGCRFRCSYCHNDPLRKRYAGEGLLDAAGSPGYVRRRTVRDVIAELREYDRLYGDVIKVFSFTDDMFITDRTWFLEFSKAYRNEFDKPLVFNSTASVFDDEVARACADAGTYMVRIGVESGSPRVQREILHRPVTNAQISRAVKLLQGAGVNVMTYNMLAIPGETMKDVWATYRFAASIHSDAVRFSVFWPYPGTILYDMCVRDGLLETAELYRGNYLSASPLRWPARRRRFYSRVHLVQAAALNMFLDTPFAGDFRGVIAEMSAMTDRQWAEGGGERVSKLARELQDKALDSGHDVYTSPFPERTDIMVLTSRHRLRPLINA